MSSCEYCWDCFYLNVCFSNSSLSEYFSYLNRSREIIPPSTSLFQVWQYAQKRLYGQVWGEISSAPLLWFSSRYIWVSLETGVARWQEILRSQEVNKKFQEEPCVSIPVVLFIHYFAGFKPNISYRVCFSLTPVLLCRDQYSWQLPRTVAWLVFPTA